MSPNEVRQATQLAFRIASYCASGECVEVGQRDNMVVLRDSTQPHGTLLHYPAGDWGSFVGRIKSGQLDDLGS
jgi:Domain of unknown function (DUF397)